MVVKPFAFVLMPFDSEFDDIYKLGIQAAAKESGIVAERVDEQSYSETILERIYRQIIVADFIIADMTGRNANVFYEVGYAHAKGKLCTLLTQSAADIPFDLSHHRHIIYEKSIHSLRQKLRIEFDWLKSELEKRNTNAFSVELKSTSGQLISTEWSACAEIEFVFDIHNRTPHRSPEIEAIYIYTGAAWRFTQGDEECASTVASEDKQQIRHFIKSPVARLSTGAWAQLKIKGKKLVWLKHNGKELQEKYTMSGNISLEISTSEGNFKEKLPVSVEIEEFPF